MGDDPKCAICGERLSAHVATDSGPHTHPREARGEGHYVLVRDGYTQGMGPAQDDVYVHPLYRFEEAKVTP